MGKNRPPYGPVEGKAQGSGRPWPSAQSLCGPGHLREQKASNTASARDTRLGDRKEPSVTGVLFGVNLSSNNKVA